MHTIDTLPNQSCLLPDNFFQVQIHKISFRHITEHEMGLHLIPKL